MTSAIITPARFRRFGSPLDILPVINHSHRGASMLDDMCFFYHRIYTRDELMEIGKFRAAEMGPVCAVTAFCWWIMRINDRLPRTGWRINETRNYRLTPITEDHARMLERRLNQVAA